MLGVVRTRRLAGLGCAVAVLFAGAALGLPHSPSELRDLVLGAGVLAPLIALGAWAVLTPALFPGTVLAAASGLAFGRLGGVALALGGAVLGGLLAFLLARTLARESVRALVARSDRLRRLDSILEARGFAAVLAARVMPGMPVTGLHYVAGASGVRLAGFAAAIAVGALLRTAPYALLGEGLGSGSVASLGLALGSIGLGGVLAAVLARRLLGATP